MYASWIQTWLVYMIFALVINHKPLKKCLLRFNSLLTPCTLSMSLIYSPPQKVVDKPCDVREPVSGTLGIVSVVFGLLIPFLLGIKLSLHLKFKYIWQKCQRRFSLVLIRVMDSTVSKDIYKAILQNLDQIRETCDIFIFAGPVAASVTHFTLNVLQPMWAVPSLDKAREFMKSLHIF